jgi:sensor histidine kinase YesM
MADKRESVAPPAGPSRRFWLVYAVAWIPYLAAYVAVFLLQDQEPRLGSALLSALLNVVPAALLGGAVVRATRRVSLRPGPAFFVLHAAGAVAYSVLWFALVMAGLTVRNGILRGDWTPVAFDGAALYWQLLQGALLYPVVAGVAYALRTVSELRRQEDRVARAELRLAQAEALRTAAELQALRARLNPHFLFNTLHSVSALVRRDTVAAEWALERFAGMLRYVLNAQAGVVDDIMLADEWRFTCDYLALEELRLGSRLRVDSDVDPDTLDTLIPAFTLQPLVENALKHAVAPFTEGGAVRVRSHFSGDDLCLEVSDDGPGVDPTTLDAGSGVGLHVVRQRLDVRYGGRATMEVASAPGQGFRVTVRIPAGATPVPVPPPARDEPWRYAP